MNPPSFSRIMTFDFGEFGSDFQEILNGIIQTDYESVVAEIIDNSIDANAQNIWVDYYGSDYQEFATIVFDDGDGFVSEERLKESFNLGGIDHAGQRIGKYNIGMKLTPLSRCDALAVLCRLDNGKIIRRGTSNDLINQHGSFGTSDQIESTKALRYAEKVLKSETNSYRTAVILYDWNRKPSISNLTEADKTRFARDQKAYFGLIYQRPLEKGQFKLFINSTKDSGNESGITTPLDPFWSNFTPRKINQRINMANDNPLKIHQKDQFLMKCFREWGTIATPRIPLVIEFNGQDHLVYVTGYVIPSVTVHSRIPTKYKKNVPSSGSRDGPSQEEMGGLWFYRDDRCICFGPTRHPDSNKGWYNLHGSPESFLNKTRVKIDYPRSLDDYLNLSPTKDSVDPPEDFLEQVLNALSAQIQDETLRAGLGDHMPFFSKNVSKDNRNVVASFAQISSSSSSKNQQIVKDCPHCKTKGPSAAMNPWHHKDTICPAKPCDICQRDCPPGECTYECSHSDCDALGEHIERHCPLNCEHCEFPEGAGGHGDETCPKLCPQCGNPAPFSCSCACPEGCGGTVSACRCDEEDEDSDEDENSHLETYPGEAILRLVRGDPRNQELIQEALNHLSEQ
jgi:hypothetical protein